MNALSSSECSSGWTLYLEHSFLNQNDDSMREDTQFYGQFQHRTRVEDIIIMEEEKEEEEDLSMLSDASSGPPHFPEQEPYFNNQVNNGCFYPPISSKTTLKLDTTKKRQKLREKNPPHLLSLLDDTASSPVFDFSKNNITVTNQQGSTESVVDYSQGFSATYFEERSSIQDHFGFLQSSISQNELQLQNSQWFGRS